MHTSSSLSGKEPNIVALTLIAIMGISLSTVPLSAQEYVPFYAHTKAIYTTSPEAGPTSALGFIAAGFIGADSVYLPVTTFDPMDYEGMVEPIQNDCEMGFWGSAGLCHPQNVPLWLGAEMRKIGSSTYRYTTTLGEHLFFDFGVAEGESSLVYENNDFALYLIGEGEGSGNYLGLEQSTAKFRLATLDAQGEVLASALHDAPITLGSQLGAIHFMRIDSFPQMLQPIEIIGHTGTESGIYTVREAEIYDFEPGDVFQYFHESNYDNPFVTDSYYETRTVLERNDYEDSITYTFSVHRFNIDGSLDSNFTMGHTVDKASIIADIPFEQQEAELQGNPDTTMPYQFRSLHINTETCWGNHTFTGLGSSFYSCPSLAGSCYGNPQNTAPGDWLADPENQSFSPGFGMISQSRGWTVVGGINGAAHSALIYAMKNGVVCGSQVVLSTSNLKSGKQILKLYPNPARDYFRIDMPQGAEQVQKVELCDLQGRTIHTWHFAERSYLLAALPAGMYVVKATGPEKVYTQKLIVQP